DEEYIEEKNTERGRRDDKGKAHAQGKGKTQAVSTLNIAGTSAIFENDDGDWELPASAYAGLDSHVRQHNGFHEASGSLPYRSGFPSGSGIPQSPPNTHTQVLPHHPLSLHSLHSPPPPLISPSASFSHYFDLAAIPTSTPASTHLPPTPAHLPPASPHQPLPPSPPLSRRVLFPSPCTAEPNPSPANPVIPRTTPSTDAQTDTSDQQQQIYVIDTDTDDHMEIDEVADVLEAKVNSNTVGSKSPASRGRDALVDIEEEAKEEEEEEEEEEGSVRVDDAVDPRSKPRREPKAKPSELLTMEVLFESLLEGEDNDEGGNQFTHSTQHTNTKKTTQDDNKSLNTAKQKSTKPKSKPETKSDTKSNTKSNTKSKSKSKSGASRAPKSKSKDPTAPDAPESSTSLSTYIPFLNSSVPQPLKLKRKRYIYGSSDEDEYDHLEKEKDKERDKDKEREREREIFERQSTAPGPEEEVEDRDEEDGVDGDDGVDSKKEFSLASTACGI
ncbi:hypothetical protein EV368DRAFT_69807, partial [Lentinula lateritia]